MSYYFLNCILIYAQEMCHALIAIDRYVLFRYPTEKVRSFIKIRVVLAGPPGHPLRDAPVTGAATLS